MRSRSSAKVTRLACLGGRWLALCTGLGIAPALARSEGKRLLGSWDRIPRYYHDTGHLLACLNALDSVRARLDNPAACELAMWFHDAIYWPRRQDNEAQSAAWALRFLAQAGQSAALGERVSRLVMETAHAVLPSPGDAQWVVDIDLGILGQSEAVYARFEADVRKEYRWVPWPDYQAGRSRVLQAFLDRPRIYATDWFQERLEGPARANLRRALEQIGSALE